jgi:CelD/BcsL family acetyltransferase involved in cellulose biosynthesis
MRPSALGSAEIALWHEMLAMSPSLQRAFFTPTFALACERSMGRTYVLLLYSGSSIRGFLPFQFKSAWHQRLRLAERIGGSMSDAAGLIAWPDLRIDAASLMRLAGLAALFITHLVQDQAQIGLDAEWSEVGYVTDIHGGPQAYFAAMREHNRDFVRDTERRLRRATRKYGELCFVRRDRIPPDMIASLIQQKRLQYQRTNVADPFTRPGHLRLIAALNEAPAPDCRLILNRLEAGNRVLAQHLGPQHHDKLSYWLPVYDPEAREVSPGRLLLWHTIQRATEDGVSMIDRGEGDVPYKRELATGSTRYGHANWIGRTPRLVLARAWQSVEWRMQSWHRQITPTISKHGE